MKKKNKQNRVQNKKIKLQKQQNLVLEPQKSIKADGRTEEWSCAHTIVIALHVLSLHETLVKIIQICAP